MQMTRTDGQSHDHSNSPAQGTYFPIQPRDIPKKKHKHHALQHLLHKKNSSMQSNARTDQKPYLIIKIGISKKESPESPIPAPSQPRTSVTQQDLFSPSNQYALPGSSHEPILLVRPSIPSQLPPSIPFRLPPSVTSGSPTSYCPPSRPALPPRPPNR